MLVLSRREKEKLLFPNLGITVEILRIAGRSVRVGIEAPQDVRVLRHEVADSLDGFDIAQGADNFPGLSDHRLRNRMNKLQLALHLLRRQNEVGLNEAMEETIEKALGELQELDEELTPRSAGTLDKEPRRALIVEDDRNESELMAGLLRISGFSVDVASDGCHALDYLSTHERPHIVLLDMQMPRCDGRATISSIRQNSDYEGLQVFGVSGMRPEQVGVQIGPAGVDRWFTKPVNPETLVIEMKRHLDDSPTAA